MKHLHKIASIILALVLVFSMAATCYAVNTESTPNQTSHTISLKNVTDSDKGLYRAYQIFRGDMGDGKLTNITWGSGVTANEALLDALKNDSRFDNGFADALDQVEEKYYAEAAATVVAGMDDNSEMLDAFAEVVGNAYLSDTYFSNNTDADSITVTGDGYYLLMYAGTPEGGDAYTKYILQVAQAVEIDLKKDAPSLEKDIVGGQETDATSASIGDKITFQLTSTIPEMDGYDKYYYIIHDTLSAGLTFNDDILVTVNGQDMLSYTEGQDYDSCDYYVEYENGNIKIVFINFLQYKGSTGNIIVTYSATLNENAVITSEGNPNTAYLEYSNNPNYDHDGDPDEPGDTPDETPDDPSDDPTPPPTGETPHSIVVVYTTALQLNKVSADGAALTGAKFKIEGVSTGIYKINGFVFQKNANGTWYRLTDGSYTETAPTEATAKAYDGADKYVKLAVNQETTEKTNLVNEGWVDANGVMTFTGLGAGTYTITELIAPEGYNLLKNPVTVTVTYNWPNGDKEAPVWTATASTIDTDGKTVTVDAQLNNNLYSFDVVNQAGVELPSTGGIGTTIFYITGALLVLAAIILLITKKRMANTY